MRELQIRKLEVFRAVHFSSHRDGDRNQHVWYWDSYDLRGAYSAVADKTQYIRVIRQVLHPCRHVFMRCGHEVKRGSCNGSSECLIGVADGF